MITALAWGIDPALAAGLARRIDGLAVDQVNDPFDIFRSLASRDYELLLLGDAPGRGLALDVLRDLRSRGGRVPIRVACCLDRGLDGEISSRTIADMGIDRIFFRPLDVEEIALQLARLLGAQLLPARAGAREDPAASALDAVWARFREPTLRRVDVIEGAVLALLEGNLDREQQRLAEREAVWPSAKPTSSRARPELSGSRAARCLRVASRPDSRATTYRRPTHCRWPSRSSRSAPTSKARAETRSRRQRAGLTRRSC